MFCRVTAQLAKRATINHVMKAITASLASLTWNLRKVKILQETFSSHPKDIPHCALPPLCTHPPSLARNTAILCFLCTYSNYQQGNKNAGRTWSDNTLPQQLPCFMANTERATYKNKIHFCITQQLVLFSI